MHEAFFRRADAIKQGFFEGLPIGALRAPRSPAGVAFPRISVSFSILYNSLGISCLFTCVFVVGEEDVMSPGHRLRVLLLFLAAVVWITAPVLAHAVLLESSPALKSSVSGPDVPLKLRFNVRIDAARSRLTLVDPDGTQQTLEIHGETGPDTLAAEAKGLHPGTYRLRWQVLASDGHITRGEIPFTVKS